MAVGSSFALPATPGSTPPMNIDDVLSDKNTMALRHKREVGTTLSIGFFSFSTCALHASLPMNLPCRKEGRKSWPKWGWSTKIPPAFWTRTTVSTSSVIAYEPIWSCRRGSHYILCTTPTSFTLSVISWRMKSMSFIPSDLWWCRCQWRMGASPDCRRTLTFLSLLYLA
jgi:hypothetical protein